MYTFNSISPEDLRCLLNKHDGILKFQVTDLDRITHTGVITDVLLTNINTDTTELTSWPQFRRFGDLVSGEHPIPIGENPGWSLPRKADDGQGIYTFYDTEEPQPIYPPKEMQFIIEIFGNKLGKADLVEVVNYIVVHGLLPFTIITANE